MEGELRARPIVERLRILSKGCWSQDWNLFLWKAVENSGRPMRGRAIGAGQIRTLAVLPAAFLRVPALVLRVGGDCRASRSRCWTAPRGRDPDDAAIPAIGRG